MVAGDSGAQATRSCRTQVATPRFSESKLLRDKRRE